MSKRALILIDIQNDYFAGGKWSLEGMEGATANAARLARLRYENGAEDFLTVLDAERRALEAARALTVARAETARAEVEVFRALRAGAPAALAH